MMKKNLLQLIIFLLLCVGYSSAQQPIQQKNEQRTNGKYIVHKISKGETIFSICKKYNIEEKELKGANPELVNGLKTGQTINIPKKENPKKKGKQEEEFFIHTVKKGETLYSISKSYGVLPDVIVKFNPETNEGVKIDQELRIPGFSKEAGVAVQSKVEIENTAKKEFVDYEVEEGDTFYGLLRKFGITKQQLLEANPGIQPDIKVGQMVHIPKTDENPKSTSSQGKYIEHKVEQGETIYGLAAEYGVKVFDIKEINPGLEERGLVSGETIFIPKLENNQSKKESKADAKNLKTNSTANGKHAVANDKDTFNITMFLPLFLDENLSMNANNADSLGDNSKKERNLYGHSRNFLSFYEGFLIALDTMKKTGINISVDVYDSQFKQTVVDSVMKKGRLLDADLIVGPIDVKHQKNISAYSYKNQIPLVSPFSSDNDFVNSNPFYFQVNPTKDYIYRKTADYIGKEFWNKNVVVLTPYSFEQLSGGDIVELVKDKLRANSSKHNGGAVDFSRVSIGEGYWEIKDNLKKGVENVVFILPPTNKTEREAILSKAINNLYVLAEDYDITLIGMSEYTSYKSINVEYFHKLKLHYLYPNFVDYADLEVNYFIKNYRKKFLTEPNQYSYRGYDIAKLFLEAYRVKGKNYLNSISSLKINTLQSNFRLKRNKEFSGFMNSSLFVINYTQEYDVKAVAILED